MNESDFSYDVAVILDGIQAAIIGFRDLKDAEYFIDLVRKTHEFLNLSSWNEIEDLCVSLLFFLAKEKEELRSIVINIFNTIHVQGSKSLSVKLNNEERLSLKVIL